MRILIIGVGGTGKSHLCRDFQNVGLNAIDADLVPSLAEFFNNKGEVVEFMRGADKQWFEDHPFRWNERVLTDLLASNEDLYLLGLSDNWKSFVGSFDLIFHLYLAPDVLEARLASPDRLAENWLGETNDQREMVIDRSSTLLEEVRELSIPTIDASLSASEILAEIEQWKEQHIT